jgi:lysophospholipase L1-like esterase
MNLKFYLFGDSFCFGQLVSHHLTWISSLSESLNNLSKHSSVLIQNASVNGNTTRLALERMSYDVTSHSPDFLLVQFGMNDCNYWQSDFTVPRVSERAFEANLVEIVERAFLCGISQIFLCTNHPSLKGEFSHFPTKSHSENNKRYNDIIRRTAALLQQENESVIFLDNESYWYEIMESNPQIRLEKLLLPDGIHLSETGHRIYSEYSEVIISDAVKKLLL